MPQQERARIVVFPASCTKGVSWRGGTAGSRGASLKKAVTPVAPSPPTDEHLAGNRRNHPVTVVAAPTTVVTMPTRKDQFMRRAPFISGVLALVLSVATLSGQVAVPSADPGKCSLTWPGFEDQIEKQLTEGKVLKMEDVPIGVTKPQRATLESGSRFAWKPLQPGYNKGFMESYKAEIAAYKLDRMLDLHMVPPIAERKMDGKNGAAVFWIENTRPWNVKAPPQGPEPMWSRQLTRMKMFDLLIANIDRNQGNLLYDAD